MSTARILAGAANRPPDAAITKDDEIERLGRGIESLAERICDRDGIIKAQGRTIKLLICIGGSVLAVETLALAGLLWRLLWPGN